MSVPQPQLSLLKSDLAHVRRYASAFAGFQSCVLYTGEQMYDVLSSWKRTLWVMTYTVTTEHHLNAPIEKLIFSLGTSRIKNRRQLMGIHSKLFLVCKDGTPIEAFVGSQNLVAPTNENLMVRITGSHDVRELIAYFNHFWLQAKPLSTTPVESKPKTK